MNMFYSAQFILYFAADYNVNVLGLLALSRILLILFNLTSSARALQRPYPLVTIFPMNVMERLLDELDASRERLLVAIEALPDEALVRPGAAAGWSVADVLVNLTLWESELVTALMQIDQGKRPGGLLAALADPAAYNQARFTEFKGRELDAVFDDWMKVRLELEEWLEMLPDQDLTDKKRYSWLNGRTLANLIAQTTYENERRYLPEIEGFAQSWETAERDTIPLTAVTINNYE
jgi:hypothetical protein